MSFFYDCTLLLCFLFLVLYCMCCIVTFYAKIALFSPRQISPRGTIKYISSHLLDESLLRSWGNFGWPATPGKVHHCSMFSPFVDNGSHCGSLESQSFRNGFITFTRLIDLNYFLSHLFLNFFGSRHDV